MSYDETKIGNPQAIRTFANALVLFSQETQAAVMQLRGSLEAMRSDLTWADSEHATYTTHFNEAANVLYAALQTFESEQAGRLEACATTYETTRY